MTMTPGSFGQLVRKQLRVFAGDAQTDFCERGDDGRIESVGWLGAGRVDKDAIATYASEERGCHLGSSSVVGAEEENLRSIRGSADRRHGR